MDNGKENSIEDHFWLPDWMRPAAIPARVHPAFVAFSESGRRRNLRDALIIGLFLYASVTVFDLWVVPDLFWWVESLRWLLMMPMGILLVLHLRRSRENLFFDQALVGLFCSGVIAFITFVAVDSNVPAAQGYLIANYAVLVFATTAMGLPLSIACALTLLVMAVSVGIALFEPSVSAAFRLPNIAAGICIAVPTLFANWALENERRRYFLLVHRERERHRQIADQRDMLSQLAALDPLTGLANRRGFDAGLASDLTRAHADMLIAVAMFDIDSFKPYNDHFGHPAGDDALRRVAAALGETVAGHGRLGRVGGEEFVLALIDYSIAEAQTLIERCRAAIEHLAIPHPNSATGNILTISVGLATGRAVNGSIDRLARSADQALYDAKFSGRNRLAIDHPEQKTSTRIEPETV